VLVLEWLWLGCLLRCRRLRVKHYAEMALDWEGERFLSTGMQSGFNGRLPVLSRSWRLMLSRGFLFAMDKDVACSSAPVTPLPNSDRADATMCTTKQVSRNFLIRPRTMYLAACGPGYPQRVAGRSRAHTASFDAGSTVNSPPPRNRRVRFLHQPYPTSPGCKHETQI
jgi:hypothetical protein